MTIIQDDVMAVLSNSTITELSVTLPPNQLERGLYERVNKVLTNAGGRWNRWSKSHLFPSDPRMRLGLVLDTGKSTSEKQELQAFFTPREIADEMAALANVRDRAVLEPSAGHGALVEACVRAGARSVKCFDINQAFCDKLTSDGLTGVVCMDFLALKVQNRQYERVVMNPPFTKNQDIKHVSHALKFIVPGGRLVSLMAGNSDRKWFRDIQSGCLDVSI